MEASHSAMTSVSGGQAASSAPRAFPLLHHFAVVGLIAISVATMALTLLQHRLALRNLLHVQELHHVALARMIGGREWVPLTMQSAPSAGIDAAASDTHNEIARLQQWLREALAGTPVVRIKRHSLAGRTLFSTEAAHIGEDESTAAGFQSARAGAPLSELTHHSTFRTLDRRVENIHAVATYVPVFARDGHSVEAVFEITSDVSLQLQRLAETRNAFALQVLAALAALFLVLVIVVRKADATILAQALRSRRDEKNLRAARADAIRSEQFHRALLENSSEAVLLLGPDLRARYSTPADERVLGLPEASLIGLALPDYACEEYRSTVANWLEELALRPDGVGPVEFEGHHASTGRRYFLATGKNLRALPAVQGIVVNILDITERRAAELEVRRHAFFDGLTGLARREFFLHQLRKAVAHAARHKQILAIMFLDLDGFKDVNDTLGHTAGDQLLREVGARLRSTLREDDTIGRGGLTDNEDRIARLGGDEFTILLSKLEEPASAGLVAQRMLKAVSAPYRVDGREVVVTASIGIGLYPQDGEETDVLLKCADAAMYAAKEQGKNTYRYHREP